MSIALAYSQWYRRGNATGFVALQVLHKSATNLTSSKLVALTELILG